MTACCDIIMPVHNALTFAIEAIESVLEYTVDLDYRLIIIDDGSDSYTEKRLSEMVWSHPRLTLIRNPESVGFVRSCIQGYAAGDSAYILLLNSDVVVTPGWLRRLIVCAERDATIATVNPLTNYAANLAIPMVQGTTFIGMDRFLRTHKPACEDVVTGVGFCLLLRRGILRKEGFFDPIFGRGYCEESDLCMRLTTRGYRTVADKSVYIYHYGRASFGSERDKEYEINRKIFDERWSREYRRQFAAWRAAKPFRDIHELLQQRWRSDPRTVFWQTGRALLQAKRHRRPLDAVRAAVHGLVALATRRVPVPDIEKMNAIKVSGRLCVTYILDRVVIGGGVLSVIQIINRLIRLGVEARIATLFEDPLVHQWSRLYTKPIIYRNEQELIENFPPSDIVVATLWKTAPWARAIIARGRARTGIYFIQDYEPWFFPLHANRQRKAVESTFGFLNHRIVKSSWLAGLLQSHGYESHKIPIGIDLDSFYPRDQVAQQPRVTAMVRPLTPWRGFQTTIEALHRVKSARPDVQIHLFGDRSLHRYPIPFPFIDQGIISNQNDLAHLYSSTDVFLDGSDFQGLGRCALEAMACGSACVLTGIGGVNEYAADGHNALLFPPGQPARLAEGVLDLLQDADHREQLASAGRDTARRFCHRREAQETLDYFQSLLEKGDIHFC